MTSSVLEGIAIMSTIGEAMPPEKGIFKHMYGITDNTGDHRLLIEQQLSKAFAYLQKVQGSSIQLQNEFLGLLVKDRAVWSGAAD